MWADAVWQEEERSDDEGSRPNMTGLATRSPPPPDGSLFDDYTSHGVFDELIGPDGAMAAHWHPFFQAFDALDEDDRQRRMRQINDRVRETGIAHDLFADPGANAQPWRLDLVPLVFSPQAWAEIERGVIQRARLMQTILADIYGEQKLMAQGLIPPQLVFSDPNYLQACQHIQPTAGHLQFFAIDIARGIDGQWRVIDTHAETPAGIGYALANRVVHSHVASDLFAACSPLRLASFFQQMQKTLVERVDRPDPAIALLTSGPHHSDFFNHAYLARYLGFLLLEGADLGVVDDRVYLKTLEGMRPVDVIVRCVTSALADPLELDPSGFLGPAGLVQAARKHPNLLANALGSAIAENRGLGGYLPGLARSLLGEELALWDGKRWWLGDDEAQRIVLQDLGRFVIRPAYERTDRPGRAMRGRDPALLSAEQRRELIREIGINGARLVAEEKAGFGTTPSFGPGGLVPKTYAVRIFASATADGFAVMPGGLAMTVDPSAPVALSAPEGEARDVWVLSDRSAPPFESLWRVSGQSAAVQRAPHELPSRVADNLFWLGRYTERADWTLRVLRISLSNLQEDMAPRQGLRPARKALELLLEKDPHAFETVQHLPTEPRLIAQWGQQLLSSTSHAYALPRTLDSIHRIAGLTRDRLSVEAWRTLNSFHAPSRTANRQLPLGETLDRIDAGLSAIAAFNGLIHENMTRNFGWSFLNIGRRLSRALNLAELLHAVFGAPLPPEELNDNLIFSLDLADSFITYRSRYRVTPQLPLVLDLLVSDETNPRSIAFQLVELANYIDHLPQSVEQASRTSEQRTALQLLTDVRLIDEAMLTEAADDPKASRLIAMLARQVEQLPLLSDGISRRYFSLSEKEPRWVRARLRQDV